MLEKLLELEKLKKKRITVKKHNRNNNDNNYNDNMKNLIRILEDVV